MTDGKNVRWKVEKQVGKPWFCHWVSSDMQGLTSSGCFLLRKDNDLWQPLVSSGKPVSNRGSPLPAAWNRDKLSPRFKLHRVDVHSASTRKPWIIWGKSLEHLHFSSLLGEDSRRLIFRRPRPLREAEGGSLLYRCHPEEDESSVNWENITAKFQRYKLCDWWLCVTLLLFDARLWLKPVKLSTLILKTQQHLNVSNKYFKGPLCQIWFGLWFLYQ